MVKYTLNPCMATTAKNCMDPHFHKCTLDIYVTSESTTKLSSTTTTSTTITLDIY